MKSSSKLIKKTSDFSFSHSVLGHGWYDLAPFDYDESTKVLNYTFEHRKTGSISDVSISETNSNIKLLHSVNVTAKEAIELTRHILRMDEAFVDFYAIAKEDPQMAWAARSNAGRLLRSATVYEDLIKTMCTTNCSWSLTKSMVNKLVSALGAESLSGSRAFPSPSTMALQTENFYRNEIKAGYRSPYLVETAELVASGKIDPESWLSSELPTAELKKEIKKIKGIGDYAAENLLKLLGRYDGLALDSWLRGGFYKKYNRGKICDDNKIERHYHKYGQWRGLAIWCDMTKEWFAETKL